MSKLGPLLCVALGTSTALAAPLAPEDVFVVEPERNVDRAVPVKGMPWCDAAQPVEQWPAARFKRSFSSHSVNYDYTPDGLLAQILEQMCFNKNDPTWAKQAMYVIQIAMNADGEKDQAATIERMKRLLVATSKKRADDSRVPTEEDRFAFSEHHLTAVAPGFGVEAAKVGATVPWCDGIKVDEKWDAGRIGRTAESRDGLVDAARQLCRRPTDATWRQKAQIVLQQWMNWTKQSQTAAIQSLRTRSQTAKVTAERAALCDRLVVGAELAGEAKANMQAYRRFFNCHDVRYGETWQGQHDFIGEDLGYHVDGSAVPSSPIAHLYWLFSATSDPRADLPSQDSSDNAQILAYAYTAPDFARIDDKALASELTKPLFGGGEYVRAAVSESLGKLRWRKRMFDAAIAKLAQSDAAYKKILVDAPALGWQQYDKLAREYPTELAHIAELDTKLAAPSKTAVAGCAAPLTADLGKLIKSYKLSDMDALFDRLAIDPIAGMIQDAQLRCGRASEQRVPYVVLTRVYRGPRSFAYFSVLDELVAALADRPRLALSTANFHNMTGSRTFALEDAKTPEADLQATVSKVTTANGETTVAFQRKTSRVPERICRDTNRITRIDESGNIYYQQSCRTTGKMVTVDLTPSPKTFPSHYATAIKPGSFIGYSTDRGKVIYVKAKSDDKKLLAFFGYSL